MIQNHPPMFFPSWFKFFCFFCGQHIALDSFWPGVSLKCLKWMMSMRVMLRYLWPWFFHFLFLYISLSLTHTHTHTHACTLIGVILFFRLPERTSQLNLLILGGHSVHSLMLALLGLQLETVYLVPSRYSYCVLILWIDCCQVSTECFLYIIFPLQSSVLWRLEPHFSCC